jgi:hypothetical protein
LGREDVCFGGLKGVFVGFTHWKSTMGQANPSNSKVKPVHPSDRWRLCCDGDRLRTHQHSSGWWFQTLLFFHIWGWVKTLVPSEPQNSWKMDVHPTKNVSIGIDPYPYWEQSSQLAIFFRGIETTVTSSWIPPK